MIQLSWNRDETGPFTSKVEYEHDVMDDMVRLAGGRPVKRIRPRQARQEYAYETVFTDKADGEAFNKAVADFVRSDRLARFNAVWPFNAVVHRPLPPLGTFPASMTGPQMVAGWMTEEIEWLEANAKKPFSRPTVSLVMDFGVTFGFQCDRDATLFKMFWC